MYNYYLMHFWHVQLQPIISSQLHADNKVKIAHVQPNTEVITADFVARNSKQQNANLHNHSVWTVHFDKQAWCACRAYYHFSEERKFLCLYMASTPLGTVHVVPHIAAPTLKIHGISHHRLLQGGNQICVTLA